MEKKIEENNNDLELVILNAVEDGEISIDNLRLVVKKDQVKIFNEFLSIQNEIDKKYFSDEKFFNLLHRVSVASKISNQSFDDIIKNFQVILKNSHHLTYGLKNDILTEATLSTLLDMLDSKYSILKDIATNILEENKSLIKDKFDLSSHKFEQSIYEEALGKLNLLQSKN